MNSCNLVYMRKAALFIFFLTLPFLSCRLETGENSGVKASGGYINLKSYDFDTQGPLALTGEWLMAYGVLQSDMPANDDDLLKAKVPGIWNGIQYQQQTLNGNGVATYFLRVELDPGIKDRILSLRIPNMATAYRLFINGKIISENGKVSANASQMVPQYHIKTRSFVVDREFITIAMQISNFHHKKGGFWNPLILGSENSIESYNNTRLALDLFLFGALIIMALYHFGLFALRRQEKSALYFALFCLVISLRVILMGEIFISKLYPQMNWEFQRKLEYLTFFVSSPLFILFMLETYKEDMNKIISKVFLIIAGLFSIQTIFFSITVYSSTLPGFQVTVLLMGVYLFYVLTKAGLKHREGAWAGFTGFLVFFLSVVNDLLYQNNQIRTGYIVPFGLFFFIFTKSFVLSLRFTSAFNSTEKLTRTLSGINSVFGRFVPRQILGFLNKPNIEEVNLGDQVEKNIAVMFVDIRNFTSMSENMTPEENFNFLNAYFRRLGPCIRLHGGFIDKYIGDAMMAIFAEGASSALKSAVMIQNVLHEYNIDRQKSGYQKVAAGIGIHMGDVMVGTIGETERMEATVISDAVNLAARLEGLTKKFDTKILISEIAFQNLSNLEAYRYRMLGRVKVKGKEQSVGIIEILLKNDEEINDLKFELRGEYERAIIHFHSQEFDKSAAILEGLLQKNPLDKAAQYYYERSRQYIDHGFEEEIMLNETEDKSIV